VNRPPPLGTAAVVSLLLAAAVRVPASAQLPSALAGALAAPLAALVAGQLAGPRAARFAGALIALSPIHTLASRDDAPEALLVTSLLCALWLLAVLDQHGQRPLAVALGLVVGGLLACGVSAFAVVAALLPAWLASRRDRRAAAGLAALVALAVVAAAAFLGLARSPFDLGQVPAWMPATTTQGLVRCSGASFARVIGLEYHLVVSHSRYLLPLTLLFVTLMISGAIALPARPRGLLVAAAVLPFAFGAALALTGGRVMPLQAQRLVAALPFAALLLAAGLASLRGACAWSAGALVIGSLVAFQALALAR
jgi:4-amino-4-deoxy-L-arabinose transferase-like glycosyltransferase